MSEILKIVKIELLKKDYEVNNLVLGLEDGSLIDLESDIGTIYKRYRNKDDKILYVLVTNEKTMYGYILSIIKYLASGISTFINKLTKE
jgi:arginyl-tRNA synthetase